MEGVEGLGGFKEFLHVAAGAAELYDDLFAVDFFPVHLGKGSRGVPNVVEFDEALVTLRRSFSQFLHRTWKIRHTENNLPHAIQKQTRNT